MKKRNMICIVLFVACIVLAVLALPFEPLQRLTPTVESITRFTLSMANQTVARIQISLKGAGGISAGNPLDINITIYLNHSVMTAVSQLSVTGIEMSLAKAYTYPLTMDDYGMPSQPIFNFTKTDETKLNETRWLGGGRVIFYSPLEKDHVSGYILFLDHSHRGPPQRFQVVLWSDFIKISQYEVTASAKTNAYVMTFTLIFGGFSCLGFWSKSR